MIGIGVTIVLVYLAIGAMLWALVLHPLDQARAIPLTILTWPRHIIALIMIVIAAGFAFAVRIVGWSGRDTTAADDPYFFAFGEMPTLPDQVSAGAHQRNESGGRTASSPRSSAAALTSSKGARHV